jgi:hypothetical protein
MIFVVRMTVLPSRGVTVMPGPDAKQANLLVELFRDTRTDEWLGADRRTTHCRAVDGEVHARVIELLADALMLDLVERDQPAAERHELLLEDVAARDRIR